MKGRVQLIPITCQLNTNIVLYAASSCIISLTLLNIAQAGSCPGGGGVYICSGAANGATDTSQNITEAAPLSITTSAGFGIDTARFGFVPAGDSIVLTSDGGLSFTDNNQSSIASGRDAIRVTNQNSGSSSITASASISAGQTAIASTNHGANLTINAQGDVTGNFRGLDADNRTATGIISIVSTGMVTGTTNDGIRARNNGNADIIINTQNDVTGGRNGILAVNNGAAAINITAENSISGGTDFGIQTRTGGPGSTLITLNAGSTVSSTAGLAISNDSGNSTTIVNTGANITGQIQLNDGSDVLTFAGGNFSGVTLFDGGDDLSVADTFIDTLAFTGSSASPYTQLLDFM